MSHGHLRKEKDCLNCGATVTGEYCQNCGQRNVVPRQTFWHLVTHFFNDITHFDGKFFTTLKLLLFRPGFLSSEWVLGRRTKYLDPVRMYLFISAIFFITIDPLIPRPPIKYYEPDSPEALLLKQERDSAAVKNNFHVNWTDMPGDSTGEEGVWVLSLDTQYMRGMAFYEAMQQKSPEGKHKSWLRRYFDHRTVAAYDTYNHDPYAFFPNTTDKFIHSFSKIFFISLPIFTFLLWLFYIRSRKTYYYVSHAIFSIHYYSIAFVFLAASIVLTLASQYLPDSIYDPVNNVIAVASLTSFVGYLLIAMKRFYQQNWFKTVLKALCLFIIQITLLGILMIAFLFNSFFSMGGH
jgi:hypothetical protein